MNNILIIDDDQELCALLSEFLRRESFAPSVCFSAKSALLHLEEKPPHLIILDIMMPDMDGFSFLKKLRALPHPIGQTPVLVLSARGDDVDSIAGLELGADDYLGKPFNTKVLLARMRAILRRYEAGASLTSSALPRDQLPPTRASEQGTQLQSGTLILHRGLRTVKVGDEALPLTSTELSLMEYLLLRRAHPVSKRELYEQVLGHPFDKTDRSVDMHISNLRNKLMAVLGETPTVKTVRGVGYEWVHGI